MVVRRMLRVYKGPHSESLLASSAHFGKDVITGMQICSHGFNKPDVKRKYSTVSRVL